MQLEESLFSAFEPKVFSLGNNIPCAQEAKLNLNLMKVAGHGYLHLGSDSVIAAVLNEQSSQLVVIEGEAGSGKTTLVYHLLKSGTLEKFKLVLHIELEHKTCRDVRHLHDISNALNTTEEQLQKDIDDNDVHVLIAFDGFDQLVTIESWRKSIFADILFRKMFPKATILLLLRPSGVQYLLDDNIKINHHFSLNGLTIDDSDNYLSPSKMDMSRLLTEHPQLASMCKNPQIAIFLSQFCEKNRRSTVNCVITDVCMYIVTDMVKRELRKWAYSFEENLKLFALPPDIHDMFERLCKLAFQYLTAVNDLMSLEDHNRFLSAFSLCNAVVGDMLTFFGLAERVVSGSTDTHYSTIKFLHPLLQQFLAGFHLFLQPPLDQIELLHEHALDLLEHEHTYWLKFFFGLTWQKETSILGSNPTKLMAATLLDFLIYQFKIDKLSTFEGEVDSSMKTLTLLLCIAETKDDTLWKKIVSKLGASLCLKLTTEIIKCHKLVIATMVNNSGVMEWTVRASNFSPVEELEIYVSARLHKWKIATMDCNVIELSPHVGIEAASRRQIESEKFEHLIKDLSVMNHFHCKAIREILQREFQLFQLHSNAIRIKADASNPAYVSFLSCDCFKRIMDSSIEFDPPLAYHFLQVTSAKTLKKLEESHSLHLATHGGQAIELVVLLKPCVRRITLSLPHSGNKHSIVFMSEELAQRECGRGAIACIVEEFAENFTTCFEEKNPAVNSEMIRPSLPLPSMVDQSTRASTVLPAVTTPGSAHGTKPLTVIQEEPHIGEEQRQHL